MNTHPAQLNLVFAWTWILLGFVSGMVLGMFFHRENWLGGYASLKRRMYRLGHISLSALVALNLLFYFTVQHVSPDGALVTFASWSFVVGAVTMPIGCVVMAHFPKARMFFAVPVISLIAGAIITLIVLLQPDDWKEFADCAKSLSTVRSRTAQTCAVQIPPAANWMPNSY